MSAKAVAANQRYASMLGWSPGDFGALRFDDALVDMIRLEQSRLGFTGEDVDGICGPATFKAVLRRQRDLLLARKGDSPEPLADAGEIALREAKLVWLTDVVDPPTNSAELARSRKTIDDMIRTPQGLDWSWWDPYVKNGDYEWCGAFAAFAWRAAGITREARYSFFSSVYRLDRWARYRAFENVANPRPAAGPLRKIIDLDESSGPLDAFFDDDDGPRAGDILLVGGVKTGPGKHITVVESYDATTGVFTTIEGNGTGAAPSGRRQHGVVRAQRPVGLDKDAPETRYHARRLIRPAPADLV